MRNYNVFIGLCNSFYRAVYLRTQPDVVYHRMKARARQEETEVPISYLQQLHQMHEDWLFNKTAFSCPAPVNYHKPLLFLVDLCIFYSMFHFVTVRELVRLTC